MIESILKFMSVCIIIIIVTLNHIDIADKVKLVKTISYI